MATRATINFYSDSDVGTQVFVSHDGYPSSLGVDLVEFLTNHPDLIDGNMTDVAIYFINHMRSLPVEGIPAGVQVATYEDIGWPKSLVHAQYRYSVYFNSGTNHPENKFVKVLVTTEMDGSIYCMGDRLGDNLMRMMKDDGKSVQRAKDWMLIG